MFLVVLTFGAALLVGFSVVATQIAIDAALLAWLLLESFARAMFRLIARRRTSILKPVTARLAGSHQ